MSSKMRFPTSLLLALLSMTLANPLPQWDMAPAETFVANANIDLSNPFELNTDILDGQPTSPVTSTDQNLGFQDPANSQSIAQTQPPQINIPKPPKSIDELNRLDEQEGSPTNSNDKPLNVCAIDGRIAVCCDDHKHSTDTTVRINCSKCKPYLILNRTGFCGSFIDPYT